MPRKELDQAGVDLTNARNQYEIAQQHLDALIAVGKQQNSNRRRANWNPPREVSGRGRATELFRNSQPDRRRGHRPPALSRRDGCGRDAAAHRDGHFTGHRPRPHSAAEAALLKSATTRPSQFPGEEDRRRQDHGGQPGARSQQHHGRNLGAGEESRSASEAGHQRAASMLAQTIPDALVIPAAALLTAQDGDYFGDASQRRRPRAPESRQGWHSPRRHGADLEGLQAGDRVVASGAYGLPDKSKIKVESPNDK